MTAPAATAKRVSYRVAEIFGPTIQGEGVGIGRPTMFVRFGGCDFRCSWCDSLHAVLPEYRSTWERMEPAHVLQRLTALARDPMLVTLSGGNPALQPLGPLIRDGHAAGWTFALETQGSTWPLWLEWLDHLTLSPKPPSAGEPVALDAFVASLAALTRRMDPRKIEVKVVVMDFVPDLQFVQRLRGLMPSSVALVLSVGNPWPPRGQDEPADLPARLLERWERLARFALDFGWYNVRVTPQLHVLAWGNRRGV